MATYNLVQTRQMIAQNMGIQNSANPPVFDFDNSTPYTQTQINNWINDTIRENTSLWDYTFLESTKSINFYNVSSGVQGVSLYGINISGVGVSGTIAPYPSQSLQYSVTADYSVQDIQNNFSGITFTGIDPSGVAWTNIVSTSGNPSYNNTIQGVNNVFQLGADVAKIEGLFLQSAPFGGVGFGIPLTEMTYHDFAIKYSIGVVAVSGTPYEYAKLPGLGPDTNLVITLAPYPTPDFSGNSMVLHYMKKHVDLVNDTDQQNIIPTQFQQIIILGVCEKIASFYAQQDPRVSLFNRQKENLIVDMKQWDFNQANKARRFSDASSRNGPYGGNRSAYDTSQNIYLP